MSRFSPLPLPVRALAALLALAVLLVLGYGVYYLAAYYRIEDNLPLEVQHAADSDGAVLSTGQEYAIATWNLGFGAYSADFSFFMDGGTESRAYSAEAVRTNIGGAVETLRQLALDFVLLQEVDVDATRSHHVNEYQMAAEGFSGFENVLAINFDSPYLFWPLLEPHGKSLSGIVTFSRFPIESALRRSLPIDKGITRVVDLDRCYSISELPVENGRKLYLINIHASAYSEEPETVPAQMQMLAADLEKYYAGGENYVIVGGDFNQDLPGDSALQLNGSTEGYSWARAFDRSALPDHISVADYTQSPLLPTTRNCDTAYQPGKTFVLCMDGFLVSDNVEVRSVEVLDEGFVCSDHNPVRMEFLLKG